VVSPRFRAEPRSELSRSECDIDDCAYASSKSGFEGFGGSRCGRGSGLDGIREKAE